MMIEIVCPSEIDTRAAAGRLAPLCRPGDVVVLDGALGVGKTAFVSGLADGLGVEETVNSPTFVMMRRYDSGFLPLVHVDVYRIHSMSEFDDLGALENGSDGVVVIEWGSMVAASLPDERLVVAVESDEHEGKRTIRFQPHGLWLARPLGEVLA